MATPCCWARNTALVAQLEEQRVPTAQVAGSTPAEGTSFHTLTIAGNRGSSGHTLRTSGSEKHYTTVTQYATQTGLGNP